MSTYKLLVHVNNDFYHLLSAKAFAELNCLGIEEYSMNEGEVDSLLGKKSFSGGNLPNSVLNDVDEFMTKDTFPIALYFSNLEEAQLLKKYCYDNFQKESFVEKIKDEDWNANWRKTYKTIEFDKEFAIIPSWEKGNQHPEYDKELYIYPGMGFGTGNHETTYLCLKVLLKLLKTKKFNTCLDFGCGSGILGLAYRIFNLECQIDLYDIDDDALLNCVQNIELNNLTQDKINLWNLKNKKRIESKYELVFANILEETLIEEKETILRSLDINGDLIISGLLQGQDKRVVEMYQKLVPELVVIDSYKKNDWLCVHMRRG